MEEIRNQLECNLAELKLSKESKLEKEQMASDEKIARMEAAALIQ